MHRKLEQPERVSGAHLLADHSPVLGSSKVWEEVTLSEEVALREAGLAEEVGTVQLCSRTGWDVGRDEALVEEAGTQNGSNR